VTGEVLLQVNEDLAGSPHAEAEVPGLVRNVARAPGLDGVEVLPQRVALRCSRR
jgi:hypothetical protein